MTLDELLNGLVYAALNTRVEEAYSPDARLEGLRRVIDEYDTGNTQADKAKELIDNKQAYPGDAVASFGGLEYYSSASRAIKKYVFPDSSKLTIVNARGDVSVQVIS